MCVLEWWMRLGNEWVLVLACTVLNKASARGMSGKEKSR